MAQNTKQSLTNIAARLQISSFVRNRFLLKRNSIRWSLASANPGEKIHHPSGNHHSQFSPILRLPPHGAGNRR
jgi:hypothetical protein